IVTRLTSDPLMERRLQQVADRRGMESLKDAGLPLAIAWRVTVYPPGAPLYEPTYTAEVSLSGRVTGMSLRLDPEAKGSPPAREGRRGRAAASLTKEGPDRPRYEQREIVTVPPARRTDLPARYRDRRNPLPAGNAHGVEVLFAGDRLAGFDRWLDDPKEKDL